MIETAIRISDGTIRVNLIDRIIQLGKEMLNGFWEYTWFNVF
jgi:hypothetical protein